MWKESAHNNFDLTVTCAPKGMSSLPLSEQDILQSSWLTIIQPLESSTTLVRCIRPSLINCIIACKQVNNGSVIVMTHDWWQSPHLSLQMTPPILTVSVSTPSVENKVPTPSPPVSLSVHRHYQDSSYTQTLKWCSQQLGWSCCCLLQTRERAQSDWIHCTGQKHYKFGKDSIFISLCGKFQTWKGICHVRGVAPWKSGGVAPWSNIFHVQVVGPWKFQGVAPWNLSGSSSLKSFGE